MRPGRTIDHQIPPVSARAASWPAPARPHEQRRGRGAETAKMQVSNLLDDLFPGR